MTPGTCSEVTAAVPAVVDDTLRHSCVPSPHLHRHPDVSPLFLQPGSTELLRDEAVRTSARAQDAGVDVELELWPEMPDAFQVASFLPELAMALDRIVGFVAARTGWAPLAPTRH